MSNKVKLQGSLKKLFRWPVLLTFILIVMNVVIYERDTKTGGIVSSFVVLYILVALFLYYRGNKRIKKDLIVFGTEYAQIQKEMLKGLALSYCLTDDEGNVMWMNDKMKQLIQSEKGTKKIFEIFPELTMESIFEESEQPKIFVEHDGMYYRAEAQKISLQSAFKKANLIDDVKEDGFFVAFYFFNITREKQLMIENQKQKMVTGLIYIDNYDEALDSVADVKRSVLSALIERKINQFVLNMEGVVKKTEKDKYFFAIKQQYVSQLQSSKFSVLDDIKAISIGNEMVVTLSIGLGMNGETYQKNSEYARAAIELALGRGGDQAVLKDGEKLYYYGGKTKQVQKNNRVKARVKAHALRELIGAKEEVFVMGHKIADVDSFGSALGIVKISHMLGKKAHLVIDEINNSLRPVLERVKEMDEYKDGVFIRGEQAREIIKTDSIVVVVDVNRPSYTECPELLRISKSIVVIDHHRQTSEVLEGAVLSYIEPNASSACEMVAEIVQYIKDDVKLRQPEADAMYAGIMLDTNNFTNKVGVRTFEAAAFLRKHGADVTRVRMLFRNGMDDFKARAEAVRNAEVYRDIYAISECPSDGLESPTVVGAQAANELLNISGILASFVLTEYNDKIYISARSIDDVNVQTIMERFDGGGHMNMAGAQLEGVSSYEARQIIKDTLKQMIDDGDL